VGLGFYKSSSFAIPIFAQSLMKNQFLFLLFLASFPSFAQMEYPKTAKSNQTDNYFGTNIADPYRWLEDDTAKAVGEWVDAQNELTQKFLQEIPFTSKIKNRLEKLYNHERFSAPVKVGEWYFFRKNSGLQNQSVVYKQKGLAGKPEVFIDPNALSKDGTITADLSGASLDKKFIAVSISKSGSDWQELEIYEVATGKKLDEKIEWVKFSGAAWGNGGFYYSRYDKPVEGKAFSNKNEFHKIYFHKLGTPQEKDVLVYWDKEHPLRYFFAFCSRDGKYLFINGSEGTSGNMLMVKNLSNPASTFVTVAKGFANNYDVVEVSTDKAFVLSDENAPNYKLVAFDLKNPVEGKFTTIIPESKDLLQGVSACGGKFYAQYLKNVSTSVVQFAMDGKREKEISLPGIGSAGGFAGEPEDKLSFYSFSSFNYPSTIFKLDLMTGKSEVYKKPQIDFKPDDFVVNQEFYASKDGTKIPMFIIHKKDLVRNGKNPTLLYGYGGFNISLTPSFSVNNLPFLEAGGIYAVANLRGGGEFGEAWHKAGMLENKQNVFDDCIAAARFLIKEKYTSADFLALEGRSNGGLLVGACMTQQPDLFKVAFPGVGVLDMLRYHKFTIGWGWVVEYGSSENEAQFKNLLAYSPLHNVKQGTSYPATLVTTADHDDRVVPAHSFKFAATLQAANYGPNPMLISISKKAGHGAGKPLSKAMEEVAEKWAFMLHNMGLSY
jgi:prolyl oligopeptidase